MEFRSEGKVRPEGKDLGGGGTEESLFKVEFSIKMSPPKRAHLGFQAQPTKIPRITASQRGAINVMSSPMTSQIVGFRRICRKKESKTIGVGGEGKEQENPKKRNPR